MEKHRKTVSEAPSTQAGVRMVIRILVFGRMQGLESLFGRTGLHNAK
jgi:hypothetical protein